MARIQPSAQRSSAQKATTTSPTPRYQVDLLQQALAWIVGKGIFEHLSKHGNTSWLPAQLITLAILWVWSDQPQLTSNFDQARQAAERFFPELTLFTYQGFIRALTTWTTRLRPLLGERLHQLMEQVGGARWRVGEFLVLAVDGSRITTPRTAANERAFAAPHYGRGSCAKSRRKWKNKRRRSKKLSAPVKPQIWLTMCWHLGLRMPWCWRTGPSTASEREHLLDLLKTSVFPAKTLFCADAGFIGYELWRAIMQANQHFLIRVGGNVHLLRKLGRVRVQRDCVFVWPKAIRERKQPPLMLRLLQFRGARGPVYLLTNVLEPQHLSLQQARDIYRQRWGVELQFRALKQTFGRAKLRSRTPAHALVELDWSLLGLWIVQLFAVKEQLAIGSAPERCSVASALQAIRELLRDQYRLVSVPRYWKVRLRAAVCDDYQRHTSKRARYRPAACDAPRATAPRIGVATAKQNRAYERLLATAS